MKKLIHFPGYASVHSHWSNESKAVWRVQRATSAILQKHREQFQHNISDLA